MAERVFRDIPGFPGYCACNNATVWSSRFGELRELKTWITNGRRYVGLYRDDIQIKRPVAWFIALAFCEKPIREDDKRLVCRHRDGDCSNDLPTNLVWGTHSENSQDVLYHDRQRFTVREIWQIRKWALEGWKYTQIAERLHLREALIGAVMSGRTAGYLPNEDGSKFVPVRRQPLPMTADLKARVKVDHEAGLAIRKIAAKHGVSKDQVWKFLRRNGKPCDSSL